MLARRKRRKNRLKKTTDQIINWFINIYPKILRLHDM